MEPEPKQKNIETNFTELQTVVDTGIIPAGIGMKIDGTPEANTSAKVINANESNIVPDGSDSVMSKGELRSSNFSTGNAGWRILSNGDVEFNNGTFRGDVSIGSGNSIFKADSNGIYLGNATFASAPFSSDMSGNTVVSSLRRKDFHWFTFFESIDGYRNASTGATPTLAVDTNGITLDTGADSGCYAWISKGPSGGFPSFSWDKKRSIKTTVSIINTDNSPEFQLATGSLSAAIEEHIGFRISGTSLYGHNGDGTSASQTSLTVNVTAGVPIELEAVFTPGVDIKYYVDGVLRATVTTNLPSGTVSAYAIFNAYITNNTASAKSAIINNYDFWQSN